ncbi:MAG: hypothetical protein K2K46_05340 [Lachnospiraceae bacterium]|nr:hypothetical protein [Lachnospiraceae bacterium]
MIKTEDGRIKFSDGVGSLLAIDSTGREWRTGACDWRYPYRVIKEEVEYEFRGETHIRYDYYLDFYLTDYIEAHDESEWPSFVIMGSDGIPFYYANVDGTCYYKFGYDKELGYWVSDESYKGPSTYRVDINDLIEETKTKIGNGEEINGTPVNTYPFYTDEFDSDGAPIHSNDGKTLTYPDGRVEYIDYSNGSKGSGHIVYPDGHVEYYDRTGDDKKINRIEYPDGTVEIIGDDGKVNRIEHPDGTIEIINPYADINTLGATVTLKTDCIKVKTNKKGVVAQKPLPSAVKVNNKALKRNKTFTVSYEKYTDGWHNVSAVTEEGIYRLVVTGTNGYEGVYKRRLYVTADKTIKAMSSVTVKVNKMAYTGEPITSGVIKTSKIGKRTLVEGTDYIVTYKNNTDSGTGQVILTAKEGSGLLGTKTVNFTITGNKMSKVKVTGISSITYNPNETMEQDMSNVKLAYNGTPLNKDTDFTVSYVNNTKAGTAKIVFTGKGLYNGTLTKKFKITKAPLSDSMLDDASKNIEVTYTGKALKPDVTLKNGNTPLKKGTDYTLTYKNNKKVSTAAAPAQITVKGKGSYTGSFKVNFTVIAKSNVADEKSNAKSIKPDEEDDNLTEDDAVVDETTTEEPVADETTEEEPATDEPTGDEPVTDEPAGDDPVTDEPAGDDPVTDEPAEDEPVTNEPAGDEPVADEPTGDEPVTDEPTEEEPATDEPTEEEPATDESTGEETATDKPTEEESVTDESAIDAPAVEEYSIFDIDAETTSTVETTEQ